MKRNSTFACCLWALVGMYWSFGGTVNATLDSTDNPENNVPWIFDMSKIKVPLVSVTQEQQMQERTYLEHLQIAKNLTVMTVTALEVALPPVVKNDLAGIEVVQQSKGIANEQNTLLYNLFVKYNDIHAVGEDICNDLKVPPVTRYLQLPTGDDAVEIQDLEAYTNNITDNVIDKLIRFFDQLYNANQIVSQVKMLKVVSSDVLIDKATAGLISRLGEVYHVTPNDKYKTATQKGILEAAMHEPNEIRVIKRWLNIKRNELHRIAEFITSAPAKQKMEEFKVSRPTVYLQMLDIYSLWFELFRVVYNQSYLLYNLDLFRNSVIEMVKKEDCPRSIIMAAAKGMDMIYTNTEYHKLGPKQRALLEKKLLNVRYMARKSYILPPYTLCLTRHNVLVKDFDTPTAYKADTVELSCVMEHLTNEYYYINYAAQEMQDNVKYMNKLKRKIGITDTQLVQNRVMTTRIAETIGNVLEDTERGITHIWRDVEQMGGNAEQVANPTAVLNQAFQIGSCLSRLAMMILEVYKNRCDIYTCSTQYKTISMPTRFIDDTTLLADKARQGLTDILPGYRNFRAMTIHIKNRAKIAQEDLEKRLGQPIYGVRQEIMRYRGAVDTVLRYFANVEAYRYDLNKFGSVVSRTKKLPPIQRNYEIFKAYCYASRAISDTLLLQRSLPIIQELRRQFDEFVNKVRKYKLESGKRNGVQVPRGSKSGSNEEAISMGSYEMVDGQDEALQNIDPNANYVLPAVSGLLAKGEDLLGMVRNLVPQFPGDIVVPGERVDKDESQECQSDARVSNDGESVVGEDHDSLDHQSQSSVDSSIPQPLVQSGNDTHEPSTSSSTANRDGVVDAGLSDLKGAEWNDRKGEDESFSLESSISSSSSGDDDGGEGPSAVKKTIKAPINEPLADVELTSSASSLTNDDQLHEERATIDGTRNLERNNQYAAMRGFETSESSSDSDDDESSLFRAFIPLFSTEHDILTRTPDLPVVGDSDDASPSNRDKMVWANGTQEDVSMGYVTPEGSTNGFYDSLDSDFQSAIQYPSIPGDMPPRASDSRVVGDSDDASLDGKQDVGSIAGGINGTSLDGKQDVGSIAGGMSKGDGRQEAAPGSNEEAISMGSYEMVDGQDEALQNIDPNANYVLPAVSGLLAKGEDLLGMVRNLVPQFPGDIVVPGERVDKDESQECQSDARVSNDGESVVGEDHDSLDHQSQSSVDSSIPQPLVQSGNDTHEPSTSSSTANRDGVVDAGLSDLKGAEWNDRKGEDESFSLESSISSSSSGDDDGGEGPSAVKKTIKAPINEPLADVELTSSASSLTNDDQLHEERATIDGTRNLERNNQYAAMRGFETSESSSDSDDDESSLFRAFIPLFSTEHDILTRTPDLPVVGDSDDASPSNRDKMVWANGTQEDVSMGYVTPEGSTNGFYDSLDSDFQSAIQYPSIPGDMPPRASDSRVVGDSDDASLDGKQDVGSIAGGINGTSLDGKQDVGSIAGGMSKGDGRQEAAPGSNEEAISMGSYEMVDGQDEALQNIDPNANYVLPAVSGLLAKGEDLLGMVRNLVPQFPGDIVVPGERVDKDESQECQSDARVSNDGESVVGEDHDSLDHQSQSSVDSSIPQPLVQSGNDTHEPSTSSSTANRDGVVDAGLSDLKGAEWNDRKGEDESFSLESSISSSSSGDDDGGEGPSAVKKTIKAPINEPLADVELTSSASSLTNDDQLHEERATIDGTRNLERNNQYAAMRGFETSESSSDSDDDESSLFRAFIPLFSTEHDILTRTPDLPVVGDSDDASPSNRDKMVWANGTQEDVSMGYVTPEGSTNGFYDSLDSDFQSAIQYPSIPGDMPPRASDSRVVGDSDDASLDGKQDVGSIAGGINGTSLDGKQDVGSIAGGMSKGDGRQEAAPGSNEEAISMGSYEMVDGQDEALQNIDPNANYVLPAVSGLLAKGEDLLGMVRNLVPQFPGDIVVPGERVDKDESQECQSDARVSNDGESVVGEDHDSLDHQSQSSVDSSIPQPLVQSGNDTHEPSTSSSTANRDGVVDAGLSDLKGAEWNDRKGEDESFSLESSISSSSSGDDDGGEGPSAVKKTIKAPINEPLADVELTSSASSLTNDDQLHEERATIDGTRNLERNNQYAAMRGFETSESSSDSDDDESSLFRAFIPLFSTEHDILTRTPDLPVVGDSDDASPSNRDKMVWANGTQEDVSMGYVTPEGSTNGFYDSLDSDFQSAIQYPSIPGDMPPRASDSRVVGDSGLSRLWTGVLSNGMLPNWRSTDTIAENDSTTVDNKASNMRNTQLSSAKENKSLDVHSSKSGESNGTFDTANSILEEDGSSAPLGNARRKNVSPGNVKYEYLVTTKPRIVALKGGRPNKKSGKKGGLMKKDRLRNGPGAAHDAATQATTAQEVVNEPRDMQDVGTQASGDGGEVAPSDDDETPKLSNTLLGTNVGKVSEEFDDGAKEARIRKQELENSADLAQANDLSSATSADGSVTNTLPNGTLQVPTGLDIPGPIVTATGTPLSEGEPISSKSGDLMDSAKTGSTGEAGPREARRTGLLKKLTEAAAAARAAIKTTAAVPSDDFGEIDTDTEKTDSAGHVPALVGINLASVACILMMLA